MKTEKPDNVTQILNVITGLAIYHLITSIVEKVLA